MRRRLGALLALALTLTLGLALGRWSPREARPSLAPAPTAERPQVTLAFLGSSVDPWCAPLYDAVEELCRERGWGCVSYDCLGRTDSQAGQVEDLLRGGGVQVAVLCPAEGGAELDGWTQALDRAGIRTVTLSARTGAPANGREKAHIGVPEEDLLAAAAECFAEEPGGVLLVSDVAEDPRVDAAYRAFEEAGVPILEEGRTWGGVELARDYVAQALERHPNAAGVVTCSRTGALGTAQALEEMETTTLKTLCLTCSPALLEDVAQGRLDMALTPTVTQAAEALAEALPRVVRGETPGLIPLEVQRVTPDNADTLEIGY